jgi:hypothetical protein
VAHPPKASSANPGKVAVSRFFMTEKMRNQRGAEWDSKLRALEMEAI